ncbi:MAG: hypothetical protein ABI626_08600 [Sphingomicrobium sp.]
MVYKIFAVALTMFATVAPATVTQADPSVEAGAPAASAGAKYCLWVEPITGSRIEAVRCETRDGWARLEIDVDKEWAKEGVRVIG